MDDRLRLLIRVFGVVAILAGLVLGSMNYAGAGATIGCAGAAGLAFVAWTTRHHKTVPDRMSVVPWSLEAGWLVAFLTAMVLFLLHTLEVWTLEAPTALVVVVLGLTAPLLVPGSARRRFALNSVRRARAR